MYVHLALQATLYTYRTLFRFRYADPHSTLWADLLTSAASITRVRHQSAMSSAMKCFLLKPPFCHWRSFVKHCLFV